VRFRQPWIATLCRSRRHIALSSDRNRTRSVI